MASGRASMRRAGLSSLTLLLVATGVSASAGAPPRDLLFRAVPMRDMALAGASDIAGAVRAGSATVSLPFPLLWDGHAYGALEVGPGWARALDRAEGIDPPASGPRFEVLAGEALALGPAARVLVSKGPLAFAIRWWDLRVPGVASPLGVELVLERSGTVRFQYLHVAPVARLLAAPGAGAALSGLRAGVARPGGSRVLTLLSGGKPAPGFALGNGQAIAAAPPLPSLHLAPVNATGPPPPGCVAPHGDWCQAADGPSGDATIFLDTRFEEPVIPWTTNGSWGIIPDTTCPPGATTAPGASAYVGDPATCSYAPARVDELQSPAVGPVTATSYFTFSSRLQFPATDDALILINGIPIGRIDPSTLNPALWYNFLPISLAPFAGQMVTITFRFTTGAAPAGIGWMVDDVLIYDENGANWKCVKNARYFAGAPPYADCSDTVSNDWSFNESAFCLGCTYTFYALVECGTEMHLPLSDMEGAELTITEVVTGTTPSLTCANQAFLNPASPPVIVSANCCGGPPNETWTGPAWSAVDNNGAGSVAWGFPTCPDLTGTYDTNRNGLQCSELTPACGGVLDRLSPGEQQTMDCSIQGTPGLCGIYRLDVRSGGFVWDLFANCTGDTTPNFRIFSSCTDAWAAWNPLPEIAITGLREVSACPAPEIEFTLQNLGCADLAGDVVVRAVSSCPTPDTVDWTVTGGLAANATRTESRPMTLSCSPATVTLFVDPGNLVAECSESPGSAACRAIPGADSAMVDVCQCANTLPPVPTADTVCSGLPTDLVCEAVPRPGASYIWDYEDDGTFDQNGCRSGHVYPGPGTYTARVRIIDAAGCTADGTVEVTVIADLPATEAVVLRGVKVPPLGLHFSWSPVANGASFRVARGTLRNFYDHTVEDSNGIGQCDTLGAPAFDDPDDLLDPGASYYYLVAPLSNCGSEGPWGNGREVVPPPPPIRTPDCP